MSDSLWEFASTSYMRDGVAVICLALQDELDADVNMLLAGAWLGRAGRRWDAAQIACIEAACAAWRARCLLPLRAIRRDLKQLEGAENWYQRIKALELEAERHQLHRIEETVASLPGAAAEPAPDDTAGAIEANLHAYLYGLPAAGARARADALQLTRLLMAQPGAERP